MCFGSQVPMDELLTIRSYGRAICRSEGPTFRVQWSENGQVVSWDKHQLSMTQFRSISSTVLERAKGVCKCSTYDWKPSCDMSKVRDRLSHSTNGYAFVSDPENGLSSAYMELSRITCLASCHGLITDDYRHLNAMRRYLKLHDDFQGLLMLPIVLLGGQMPRRTGICLL